MQRIFCKDQFIKWTW